MQKGEAIEHRMVSNAIEKPSVRSKDVTSIFVKLLEYDDVANDQRRVVRSCTMMASSDISENDQRYPQGWSRRYQSILFRRSHRKSNGYSWSAPRRTSAGPTKAKWLDEDPSFQRKSRRENSFAGGKCPPCQRDWWWLALSACATL